MASKIKGINIKIGADTTGLDTALKGIESAGKKATSELREVNSSLRNNNDSVVLWKQKQELLTTALEESRKKLDFLREAQEQIKRQFENDEIDGGQYRAFQREIETAQRDVNSFENQLQQANTRLEELTQTTEESTEQIDELGEELQESGEQAENSANGGYTVLGNVFANLITKGIELAWTALKNFTQDVVATGEEYESAISNVAAISGAMSEEVEMLQAKAEEMGATTKFTAAESAEAMGYMAMAGWKVNDMVSGLDGIMDLSAASGENLASVSDIVTDALTAFGLQASDSAHFADVLAAASSNANTNVSMMGETFKYAAPIAGALGFSIEDTAEAIGLMANSGIKASQAGTSLRTILTNMASNITLFGDAFKSAENAEGKYIVTTKNADGSMRDLSEILSELREGWDKLTEAEQAANAANETIAGKNAMSGFLALMNSAPADIEKLSTAIENADGAAQGMASTMLDNLQGDKTLLDSAFDGMKIAISKELNPALRDIVQWGTQQIPKVQAVVEPLFKSAVNGVKSLINGFEKMKPVLSAVKPLIITIFANEAISLFTTKLLPKALELLGKLPTPLTLLSNLITSVAGFPTKFIETIGKVPSVVGNIKGAFQGLWTVISANPLAAFAVAATTATLALKSYFDNKEVEKTEMELLIEKHNEELQLLIDKRRAIEDLNDAFYENVDGIQNQTDRTKDLWKELDKLADQYGNVQQKDKARAEYILNELNSALGTEYTMTGNQIDNYRTLSAEIDNVIAKKQAEMMLDAYLANSTEMTKQRIGAQQDYEKADKDYKEKKKIAEEAEQAYRELTGRDSSEISLYSTDIGRELANLSQETEEHGANEEYEAGMAVYTARINAMAAEEEKTRAKNNYEATSEYFDNLEQIQEAYSLGQYDLMAEIIYAEKDLTSTTLDESATDAEQRLEIYSESLQKTLSDFKLAVGDMKQISVDELEKQISETMNLAMLAEQNPLEVWSNFKDDFKALSDAGLDITGLLSWGVDSGIPIRDILGRNGQWRDIIQGQLDAGFDITNLLKWCKNSNYTASMVLGDKFMDYLQEQLDKGADISYLLEWGSESGEEVSEEFAGVFTKFVQKQIDEGYYIGELLDWAKQTGIDLSEAFGEEYMAKAQQIVDKEFDLYDLIQWAESAGINVGKLFGENFQDYVQRYVDFRELNEAIDNASGFAVDSVRKALNAFKFPMMADGGFLHRGQAIVAEAGPELLEVMNGGVKVTPLTRSAQNTPVSDGGQKIFYSNYTINATISGSYDVWRLAEDLETERRRIENGRGM